MELAVENCPVEEKKEQEQLFDDVDKEMNVINSLDNDLSSQLSMKLSIPEKVADQEVGPEWIEPIKVACRNTEKYECSNSLGGVYCDRLLTQSHVEQILLECGIYLKELYLSRICDSSIMPIVAKNCENLTKLDFVFNSESKNNTNDYIEAFTKLKKLKSINIYLVHMEWYLRRKFPYEIINYLPEDMNEIHILIQQSVSKKAVFFDLKRFKNLQSLTLSGCNLNEMLQAISEKTTLTYLDLTDFRLSKKCSCSIEHVLNQLVNLVHVSITIDKFRMNVPSAIFNTCKNIRHLELPSTPNQKGQIISIENWENLKNLEHLTISWRMTDEDAINLVKYCKKLKHLDISRTYPKNAIQTALQELTKLENLECLKIGRMNEISAETIVAISKNCKKLKILKMESFRNLIFVNPNHRHPPSVLDNLSKLKYLERLNMPRMFTNEFHESSIIAIVDTCKNLKKLDLTNCRNITEQTLITLANFESLQKLKVSFLQDVTDNFISKLKGLKCFHCEYCENVTDTGIIQLIRNCPDLEYLNLYGTNATTKTIIGASEATKNRKNDIILYLCVKPILGKSFKSINKSIWLALCY